jgi:hypothetical protein
VLGTKNVFVNKTDCCSFGINDQLNKVDISTNNYNRNKLDMIEELKNTWVYIEGS